MSGQVNSVHGDGGPSVKERVKALHEHSDLFEEIAKCPQAGIHDIFPKEFALAEEYVESEVHRCRRAVECYLQRHTQPEEPSPCEVDHREVMMDLVNSLLLLGRFVKISRRMSSSTPPSKVAMDKYRVHNRVGEPGRRGANGELASMYRHVGEPIPFHLATVNDENLSPMAQFLCHWLLNPLIDYIAAPCKDLALRLPMYKQRYPFEDKNIRIRILNTETVEAVANALVYVLAILILVAPIATFTVVQEQSQRIVIMPLFCLLLAASAQLMGSNAMPSYTIVIAYFQAMVFYVGNSNDG